MLHMKADQITTHPELDRTDYGEIVFTIGGPVFGLSGKEVANVSVKVCVSRERRSRQAT